MSLRRVNSMTSSREETYCGCASETANAVIKSLWSGAGSYGGVLSLLAAWNEGAKNSGNDSMSPALLFGLPGLVGLVVAGIYYKVTKKSLVRQKEKEIKKEAKIRAEKAEDAALLRSLVSEIKEMAAAKTKAAFSEVKVDPKEKQAQLEEAQKLNELATRAAETRRFKKWSPKAKNTINTGKKLGVKKTKTASSSEKNGSNTSIFTYQSGSSNPASPSHDLRVEVKDVVQPVKNDLKAAEEAKTQTLAELKLAEAKEAQTLAELTDLKHKLQTETVQAGMKIAVHRHNIATNLQQTARIMSMLKMLEETVMTEKNKAAISEKIKSEAEAKLTEKQQASKVANLEKKESEAPVITAQLKTAVVEEEKPRSPSVVIDIKPRTEDKPQRTPAKKGSQAKTGMYSKSVKRNAVAPAPRANQSP